MNTLIPVIGFSILLRSLSQTKPTSPSDAPDAAEDEFRDKLRENVADKMAEVFVTIVLAAATRAGIR